MQKKVLSFRLYTQILIFSVLVGLGVLILWPLQQAVNRGMIGVRDGFIGMMEKRIDRKILYSSISPSIFGSFDVRNVRIVGKDENEVFTVSRFRISYSLWELLRGKKLAIRSVRVDSPYFDLNTVRDQDLLYIFDSAAVGQNMSLQGLISTLPDNLQLRIRSGRCMILSGNSRFELDALNCDAIIAGNRMILNIGWNLAFPVNLPVGYPVNLGFSVRAEGSFSKDLKDGDAVLRISSADGDITSLYPLSFDLTVHDNVITLYKMSDMLPFDFFLDYVPDKNLNVGFTCENLYLHDFLSFSGGMERAGQFLDIAGFGSASLERGTDGSLSYSVDMSGSTISGGSLLRTGGASFEIKAAGDEKEAHIGILNFSMPVVENTNGLFCGDIVFSGSVETDPLAVAGTLSLGNFSLSGREGVIADFIIRTREGEIGAFCRSLTLGRVRLDDFEAVLIPSEGDLGFSVSALKSSDKSYVQSAAGQTESILLEGSRSSETGQIEVSLRIDSFSAGDLMDMTLPFATGFLPPAPVRGGVKNTVITTEVFLTASSGHLLYNVPRFVFTDRGGGVDGFVSLSGTNRHFELSEGRITRGEDSLLLTGQIEFDGPNNVSFSADSSYRDIRYHISGMVLDGRSISIQASNGLNVSLNAAGKGYSGVLSADGFPLPFLGRPALFSCDVRLNYNPGMAWSAEFDRFEVTDILSPAGPGRVQISGRADQNGAEFPVLYYSDTLGPLAGKAFFSRIQDSSGFNGSVTMEGDREKYFIESSFSGESAEIAFTGSSMRLARMSEKAFGAMADGDIRITFNPADSFRAELNLSSLNAKIFDREVKASAHAVLDNAELYVNGLNIQFAGISTVVPEIKVRSREGIAGIKAEFKGFAGERPVEGRLLFEVDFNPIHSWLDWKTVDSFSGRAVVTDYKYDTKDKPEDFNFVFSRNGGALSVTGGPRGMFRLQADDDGNFYIGLSSPFPVRGSVAGTMKQNMINAHCGDLYVDLEELSDILTAKKTGVFLTGGYASASLDIRGSVTDPEFFGTLRGTSVKICIPGYIPQELRPIPFSASVNGNEIHFGPVRTAVGNGAGTIGGWFRFDRWIPDIFSMDIAVPRETPIPYAFEVSGFTAKGDVHGNLNVSREDAILDVSGDLFGNNTAMSVNIEESNRSRGMAFNTKNSSVVNLTISTGPTVEFFYPSARFPILRASPEMGTKIHVTVDTAERRFSLISDVNIRSGEIFYFERSFYIRSGTLVFRENEHRFAPRITTRAEVRDRNEEGPVTISMIVDNAPLFSFNARFESTPPLSQMEIFALMGQSFAGTGFDENPGYAQRAVLSSATDFLAQFLVVRQLERQIRSFTRLDMFSMRTQFLQNYLFTATGLTQTPVDRNGGVSNYFNNTTFLGGKYIGQDMFVQGMLSMRYDNNRTDNRGLTFEPDIGVELQSPLFSIRWNFVPTHPENWFVNDNAITLTKRWTF